jgi:hypothetical protein
MILGRTPARLLVAAFWTLFGAGSGLQIWISMLAHHHSLPLITLYQVITWDAGARPDCREVARRGVARAGISRRRSPRR